MSAETNGNAIFRVARVAPSDEVTFKLITKHVVQKGPQPPLSIRTVSQGGGAGVAALTDGTCHLWPGMSAKVS